MTKKKQNNNQKLSDVIGGNITRMTTEQLANIPMSAIMRLNSENIHKFAKYFTHRVQQRQQRDVEYMKKNKGKMGIPYRYAKFTNAHLRALANKYNTFSFGLMTGYGDANFTYSEDMSVNELRARIAFAQGYAKSGTKVNIDEERKRYEEFLRNISRNFHPEYSDKEGNFYLDYEKFISLQLKIYAVFKRAQEYIEIRGIYIPPSTIMHAAQIEVSNDENADIDTLVGRVVDKLIGELKDEHTFSGKHL